MKNPPPMTTEKMPTTKPPTRSSAVSRVSSQGASALIHERSITVLHPDARDDMHLLPLQRREPHRPPPPRIEGGLEALPSSTSITSASRNAVDVDTHARLPDSDDGIPNVPRRFMGCFDSDFRGVGQNGARPVQVLCGDGRADIRRPCHDRHWAGPATAAADPWQGSDGAVRRSRHCKNPKHPAVKRETGEDWGR